MLRKIHRRRIETGRRRPSAAVLACVLLALSTPCAASSLHSPGPGPRVTQKGNTGKAPNQRRRMQEEVRGAPLHASSAPGLPHSSAYFAQQEHTTSLNRSTLGEGE